MIGANKDVPLAYATCYKDEYVIKYPITSLQKISDIDSIVDENIKLRIKARIEQFGGKIKEVIEIEIPFADFGRKLVVIEKEKETPKQFPRKPNKIKK